MGAPEFFIIFSTDSTTVTMASVTSIVKTADFILSRPTLSKVIQPLAKTFSAYAGYREMGLK